MSAAKTWANDWQCRYLWSRGWVSHLLCSVEVLLESPGSLAGHDPVLFQLLQNRVHLTLSQSAQNRREGRILALLGISSLCSPTSPLPLTVPCSPWVLEQSGPVPVPLPTAPEPSSLSSCVLKPQSPAYDGSPERRQSVANMYPPTWFVTCRSGFHTRDGGQ